MIKRMLPIALAFGLALSGAVLAATPVNINKADAATIAKSLDGIGMAKAEAIVAYREKNGAFDSAAQLVQVKGIGERTVERNRKAIRTSGKGGAKN